MNKQVEKRAKELLNKYDYDCGSISLFTEFGRFVEDIVNGKYGADALTSTTTEQKQYAPKPSLSPEQIGVLREALVALDLSQSMLEAIRSQHHASVLTAYNKLRNLLEQENEKR